MTTPRLTSRTLYFALLGGIGLLIAGLVGGAYLANQVLNGQATKLAAARASNSALEAQQQQLDHTKKDIARYQGLADIAKGVVPQDKDQVLTVRDIVRIANANGIQLASITFPSSTLGGTAAPGAKANLSQLAPVVGLAGVYKMPITVQSDTAATVPYGRFINFLSGLERNRRTALVSAMNLQPSATRPGTVSFSITVDQYIKP